MGDFNWVSPNFLAFASPQHEDPKSHPPPDYPTEISDLPSTNISQPFKNVLEHFTERDIGLVVRLNSRLYPAEYFESMGMTHKDMIFEDGTCPPLSLVRKFINLAHHTITQLNRHVAVHCKAGLGRTGCLIGAYLVYRYGFTANEVIAYMRFMRPGMVVGPQQHWLHLNQNEFRQWWWEDTILNPALEKAAALSGTSVPKTPSKKRTSANTATPSTRRSILGEMDHNHTESAQAAALPAPTPGQPRKTSSRFPGTIRKPSTLTTSKADENEFNSAPQPSPERGTRRRKSGGPGTAKITIDEDELARAIETGMTEEEYIVRMQKRTVTTSTSTPARNPEGGRTSATATGSKRVVSYTTTTTHTVKEHVAGTNAITPEEKRAERAERVGNGVSSGIRRSSPRKLAGSGGAPVAQPATVATKEVGTGVRKVSGGVVRR